MIGRARVGQQPIDRVAAFVGTRVRLKRRDFGERRQDPDRIERRAAQECEVVAQGREFQPIHAQLRPRRAFLDPAFQRRDLRGGESFAARRHDGCGVGGANALE